MTQVNLPRRNITGDNLWSQVEDNDDAIADVVNGSIDNGNIAADANINGSKLLDGSIATAKLAAAAVTVAKLGLQTFRAQGSEVTATGVQTLASQASVPPGTYLAIGTIYPGTTLPDAQMSLSSLDFSTSAGTATFQQMSYPSAVLVDENSFYGIHHFAIATVTATATVILRGNKSNGKGIIGNLILFGIAS